MHASFATFICANSSDSCVATSIGLTDRTTDGDLVNLCARFGNILSAKAIIDLETGLCKGFGFVMFESPASAMAAVASLTSSGVRAAFARLQYNDKVISTLLPENDPTNIFIAGLPITFSQADLEKLVNPFGDLVSCRILYDVSGLSLLNVNFDSTGA